MYTMVVPWLKCEEIGCAWSAWVTAKVADVLLPYSVRRNAVVMRLTTGERRT